MEKKQGKGKENSKNNSQQRQDFTLRQNLPGANEGNKRDTPKKNKKEEKQNG